MIQPIFNRYERKYLITEKQKKELIPFLEGYLSYDPYSSPQRGYTIYNIYFDTKDFDVIRNSISKPKYKEKLRLRTYAHPLSPTSEVFLEIKKKFNGRVNKRRVVMTYQEAMNYLEHGNFPILETYNDKQVMEEIDYFIRIHQAKPGAFIRYDRMAFVANHEELRVTFDSKILFRTQKVNLETIDGVPILPTAEHCLMEIKSEDNFPFWLARKLSEMKLISTSFSKYGKAFEHYLIGGNHDDELILYHY